MSAQQIPTFEELREMFRLTDLKFQETDRTIQEVAELQKRTDKKISALGSRIGDIVENMVGGNIVDKFQTFGYEITQHSRRSVFKNNKLGISRQVDLFWKTARLPFS